MCRHVRHCQIIFESMHGWTKFSHIVAFEHSCRSGYISHSPTTRIFPIAPTLSPRSALRHPFAFLTLLHEHVWVWVSAPVKWFIPQRRGLSRLALRHAWPHVHFVQHLYMATGEVLYKHFALFSQSVFTAYKIAANIFSCSSSISAEPKIEVSNASLSAG